MIGVVGCGVIGFWGRVGNASLETVRVEPEKANLELDVAVQQLCVTIERNANGVERRCTQVGGECVEFVFMADRYSFLLLKQAVILRFFYTHLLSDAILYKDYYGRLFVYFFDGTHLLEEGGRAECLCVFVRSVEDAELLVAGAPDKRFREPYILHEGRCDLWAYEVCGNECIVI